MTSHKKMYKSIEKMYKSIEKTIDFASILCKLSECHQYFFYYLTRYLIYKHGIIKTAAVKENILKY